MKTGAATGAATGRTAGRQALLALGFISPSAETPRRLIAQIAGLEKTGKTHLALTAPQPIMFFDLDMGTEGVVEKFVKAGREIFMHSTKVPKEGAGKDVYEALWADMKLRLSKVYGVGEGTVVLDTATEAWELCRLARFGKLAQVMPQHYIEVNNEWREVMRRAYDSSMNTIFLQKMKPKYINNVRTAEYEAAGFGDMEYMTQMNIRTMRTTEDKTQKFMALIKDCRQNPSLCGMELEGPMFDFQFIIEMVHG